MNVYKRYTDQELTDLLKLDDELAYTEIYIRTPSCEEAKDIVQEIFVKLWANRKELHITTNLGGFLYTSARNIISI